MLSVTDQIKLYQYLTMLETASAQARVHLATGSVLVEVADRGVFKASEQTQRSVAEMNLKKFAERVSDVIAIGDMLKGMLPSGEAESNEEDEPADTE